jgi:hypothetical protein
MLPPPPASAFGKLFRISGFAGFSLQYPADKGFRSSSHGSSRMGRLEPVAWNLIRFRASFINLRVCGGGQGEMSQRWVWKNYVLFYGRVAGDR